MSGKLNGSSKSEDPSSLVCFSPTSIRLFAESAGHAEIDEASARLLAEDVSYRIRRLLDSSVNFMRNTSQTQLSTDHVNRALVNCDCKPIYGHTSGQRRIDYIYVQEANVFAQIDREVKLTQLVDDMIDGRYSLDIKERQLSLTGSWVSLKSGIVNGSNGPSSTSAAPSSASSSQPPEHLAAYYNFFIEIVFADDFALYKTVLTDLSRNTHITELLPCFLNFIELGINDVNPTEKNLFRLLMLANAVIRNKSFYTEIARNVVCLLDSLIIGVMEPIGQGKRCETHWALREYAAHTLALVLRNWSSILIANEIFYNLLQFMADLLADRSRPLDAHYGVVCFLRALGNQCIASYLLPQLSEYISGLETLLCEHENTSSETHFAGVKLHGTLLDTIVCYLRAIKRHDLNAFAKCYKQFSDLFGDSLHARIPVDLHLLSYCRPPLKKDPKLFSTTEQSGEELLQTFYPDHNSPFHDLPTELEFLDECGLNGSSSFVMSKSVNVDSLPNGNCNKTRKNKLNQPQLHDQDSDSDDFTHNFRLKVISKTIRIRLSNSESQTTLCDNQRVTLKQSKVPPITISRLFLAACKSLPCRKMSQYKTQWQQRMYSCDLNSVL
jgi:transcription initiation factor TFIID subunit 6